MDHRDLSLNMLRQTGLIPVKVRPGQKDPFSDWDPRRVHQMDHQNTLLEIRNDPELNFAALFAGRYVDVDVDSTEPGVLAALDHFLPGTPYIWGRKSKPASHRVYLIDEDFDRGPYGPILRFLKALKLDGVDYSVELRGGKPENGLYSVLPGSKHPSGEDVEWDGRADPTVSCATIKLSQLVKQLRLAMATAVVLPYWQQGLRNDMSLCLSGLLFRIRAATLAAYDADDEYDMPEGVFSLTEQDAHAVFSAVVQLGEDDPNDRRSRMLNYKNTWKKLQADPSARVTGGGAMAELVGGSMGENLVRNLYRLLSDNDGIEQLEALAEQFVVWYGQGVLVDLDLVEKGAATPWMTREQAKNSLGSKRIVIGDKKLPVSGLLFASQSIQRVHGLTFDPSTNDQITMTDMGPMVNQFKGFAVEPHPEPVSSEDVMPFLDYVREVVADEDPEIQHWVLAWMADFFQNPSRRPGTALVLVGAQGAGKSFLGEKILGPLIGEAHYTATNDCGELTHNFNTLMDNRLFIQADEAMHSGQRREAAKLKSLITDKYVRIEPKGVNAYLKPNHMRFLFTSNLEDAAVVVDPSPYERRFTVIKVASKRAGRESIPYWSELRQWTDENLPQLMRFLCDYKYDPAEIRRPLETEAKRELQRVGVDMEVAWMVERIAAGFPLAEKFHQHWWQAFNKDHLDEEDKEKDVLRRDAWPDMVSMKAIEDDYRAFVRAHGKQVYTSNIVVSLRKALPAGSNQMVSHARVEYFDGKTNNRVKTRERLYSWPSTDEILAHLKARYGGVVDELIKDAERTVRDEEFQAARQHKEEF